MSGGQCPISAFLKQIQAMKAKIFGPLPQAENTKFLFQNRQKLIPCLKKAVWQPFPARRRLLQFLPPYHFQTNRKFQKEAFCSSRWQWKSWGRQTDCPLRKQSPAAQSQGRARSGNQPVQR